MDMERFVEKRNEIREAIEFGAFTKACIERNELVCHYTSIAGLKGILENKVFFATESGFLNDDDEFSYAGTILLELVKEELSGWEHYQSFALAISEYCLSSLAFELSRNYYVISFSKNPDNLALWSQFASEGCNMQLLPLEMIDTSSLALQAFVKYEKAEQKAELKEAICNVVEFYKDTVFPEDISLIECMEGLDEQEVRLIAEPIVQLALFYGMAMKREEFKAEEEYRLIFRVRDEEVKIRQKGSLLLPYIEIPIFLGDEEKYLKQICLAPLNKGEKQRYSINRFLQHLGIGGCTVTASKMNLKY